jgi:hypothetical protein
LGQAFAVFQAFSLTKLRISRRLSQKLKFWESLLEGVNLGGVRFNSTFLFVGIFVKTKDGV